MKTRNNKKLMKFILVKVKQLCQTLETASPKRGRPKLYHDYIIVFALLLKILENLSLRDLEFLLKKLIPKAPDHTTLYYRFKKIKNIVLEKLSKSEVFFW